MFLPNGVAVPAGRRSFGDFLEQYAPPVEGAFADVDRPGARLGAAHNMLALTHGQRAGIGGASDRRACFQGPDRVLPATKYRGVVGTCPCIALVSRTCRNAGDSVSG